MVHHGYGTPWYTTVRLRCVMVYCCTMIYHGFLPWYTTVYHGAPSMVSHSLPWHTMMYHMTRTCGDTYAVVLWCTMVYHSTPYYTMVYHGTTVFAVVPWFTVVYHGMPWYTMVYGKLWYDRDVLRHGRTMVWYTMVHHGISWYTMFALKICGGPLT